MDLVNQIGKAVGKASGRSFPRWRKVYRSGLIPLAATVLVLGQVESTYGTFFVYGNHDRSRYRPDPNYTEEQLREALEGNGIRILRDEALALNGELTVIGRDDRSVPQYGSPGNTRRTAPWALTWCCPATPMRGSCGRWAGSTNCWGSVM